MNAKSIRIKDIAQLAGVSVGTVDRVLHNRGRVSEDALKKVLGVLDQIDYKPNLIARTLGANKTYRIAALMPNPEQDPYWASSKSGISQAEAEWLRYGVKVEPYFFNLYDKNSFRQVAEAVSESKPDGILVAPIFYHETLPFFELFKANGIPFVLFNTNIPEAHPVCFIGQNLYQSGKVGAELMHLAQNDNTGVITVLHINEDLGNSVHLAEKEKGFREYFEGKKDLNFDIRTLNLDDPSRPEVQQQIARHLSDDSLKGIFVTTSKGTYIIASFLEKHNKRNIKLIGYDMLQENIRYMKKGIVDFLINQNPRKQAFLGINHLVGNLILKKDAPEKDLLPLEIISPANLDSYLNSENH
jgi:LacI family transcriptional regulator